MCLKCVSMLHAQKKCVIPRLQLSSSIWRPHLSNICALEKPSAAHQLIISSCTLHSKMPSRSSSHKHLPCQRVPKMEKTQLSSQSLVLPNFQKSCSQIPRGTGRSIFFRTSQAMPNAALCPWSSCWGRLDTLVYSQLAASGVQWSHELVHSVSQCQPMTKTCGSSGQTKRTAHVPNCILMPAHSRTFSTAVPVWGHFWGHFLCPCSFFCPNPCSIGMTPEEMTECSGNCLCLTMAFH